MSHRLDGIVLGEICDEDIRIGLQRPRLRFPHAGIAQEARQQNDLRSYAHRSTQLDVPSSTMGHGSEMKQMVYFCRFMNILHLSGSLEVSIERLSLLDGVVHAD